MESQSTLTISFKQNPAVAEAVSGKQIGDKLELECHATIKEMSGDGIVLSIDAVVPDGYEVAEPDEAERMSPPAMPIASPGMGAGDETIPSAIASMVQRKRIR